MKKLNLNSNNNQSYGNYLHEDEINSVVSELCNLDSYKSVYHRSNHDISMPSIEELKKIVELLKTILFPGYFAHSELRPETMKYYIGSTLDYLFPKLFEQIKRGDCFSCAEHWTGTQQECYECDIRSKEKAKSFLLKLPYIRKMLSMDAQAAFNGDPAAQGIGETIFSYPSISALTHHRIAHELYKLDVYLIPRIISEMAHSKTGIDIHPGAEIGEQFFIDHGTGTVIGETCIIGKNVRLYQGVTLGAKSFPKDEAGNLIKGIRRHPIVEDNVIVYSGATILGRITIGENSIIGGNVWLTDSVPPDSKIVQSEYENTYFSGGEGI